MVKIFGKPQPEIMTRTKSGIGVTVLVRGLPGARESIHIGSVEVETAATVGESIAVDHIHIDPPGIIAVSETTSVTVV